MARAQVLTKAVAQMQESYGAKAWEGGTTLCAVNTWCDDDGMANVDVTNVGDSAAYLLVIDAENKCHVTPLNKLHSTNPEINREEHGYVADDISYDPLCGHRFGALNVTRTIGDCGVAVKERYVLSHIPDINRMQFKPHVGDINLVVVVSDGVWDTVDLNGSDISRLINHRMTTDEIALKLVSHAYFLGSPDHSSAAVVPLGESALVGDGHGYGGGVVARSVATNFHPVLQNTINTYYATKQQPISSQLESLLESDCWQQFISYGRFKRDLDYLQDITSVADEDSRTYQEKGLDITVYCFSDRLSMLLWPDDIEMQEDKARCIREAVPAIVEKVKGNHAKTVILMDKLNAVLGEIKKVPVLTRAYLVSFFPGKIKKQVKEALVEQLNDLKQSLCIARINIPINEECVADLLGQYQEKIPPSVFDQLDILVRPLPLSSRFDADS
jgi:serine/threonine protein phosphatase PrpC